VEYLLLSWPTLILLGLGLRMALRLNYGARGPEPGDPVYDFLSVCSWVLIALGVAPAVLGGILTFFGLIIVALAAATVVEIVTQRRAAQRRSICTLLALLIDRKQPLQSSVLLAGQTMRGGVGRSAKRLFDSLNAGTPLTQAVQENPGALPREAIAYVTAAGTTSAESAALRELSQSDHSELAAIWRACVDRISYIICVMLVMFGVLTFLMIKIVPEFQAIFNEFEVELPPITHLAIAVSYFFMEYLAAPTILALMILLIGAVVIGICYLCDVPVFRGWTDRLFRGRRTADILRILAVATEQRQPLAAVLQRLAVVYPSLTIRRQLEPASVAVESGANWLDALGKSRIVSGAEEALLKASERAGNLPWALRQIAKRREKRAVYRLASALQLLYPIVILCLGGFVGFYVVSLFVPIVKLIQGLT
jgi:type IV pilus assembly protein PilC